MNEDPRLYAIAKKVTLEAGLPYTDPRTGETTKPVKLAKWWRTASAKAATRRSEKAKRERLKLLRKLAQSKHK
jgi:hypothetical protein